MEIVKNLLAKIDGKKSYSAIIAFVAYSYLVSKGIIASDPNVWNVIGGLFAAGVLHKFEKILG